MEVFATALHLPAEPKTQDPLGFGSVASELARYFSPGLTASTGCARYFTVLCAGMGLCSAGQTAKDAVLRFERIWAFGAGAAGDLAGLRGQQSVREQLQRTGARQLVPISYPF